MPMTRRKRTQDPVSGCPSEAASEASGYLLTEAEGCPDPCGSFVGAAPSYSEEENFPISERDFPGTLHLLSAPGSYPGRLNGPLASLTAPGILLLQLSGGESKVEKRSSTLISPKATLPGGLFSCS